MSASEAIGVALILGAAGAGVWVFVRSRGQGGARPAASGGTSAPPAGITRADALDLIDQDAQTGFDLGEIFGGLFGARQDAAGPLQLREPIPAPAPAGAPAPANVNERELRYFAATLWGEARGEPRSGQEAVAEVVLNRLSSGRWGSTVESVVTWPYQFSAWLAADPNSGRVRNIASGGREANDGTAFDVAREALLGRLPSRLGSGYLHYYNPTVASPPWAAQATETKAIGDHAFLKGVA